jgi:hypothetical protein
MSDLVRNLSIHSRRRALKGILLHLDNARPHNLRKSNECLEEFGALKVLHPACSPDLTTSNFFLLGIPKTELQNYEIYSRNDLISAIRSIFGEIPKETFNSIYDSWKKSLK